MSRIRVDNVETVDGASTLNLGAAGDQVKVPGEFLVSSPVMHLQYQVAAGSSGGSASQNAWTTRPINTVITNQITGASLSSNQVTLPVGIYKINAKQVFTFYSNGQNGGRTAIYNVSDSEFIVAGITMNATTNQGDGTQYTDISTARALFEVSGSSKIIDFRYFFNSSAGSLGVAMNAGSSENEVFVDVWIEKVG